MKSCPTCNRTYADDTFTFCLDDGALLSAPYDPQSTLQIPAARHTEQPGTGILRTPSPPQRIAPASDPASYPREAFASPLPQERGGKTKKVVGGVIVLLIIGVLLLGYMVWQNNQTASSEASKSNANAQANNAVDIRPTPFNSNTNVNDAGAQPKPTVNPNPQWLEGVWEGKGYQHTPKMTWSIKLTAENSTYAIEYPSLRCGGKWTFVEASDGTAKFKETITRGLERCSSGGDIQIEKISDDEISYKYTLPVIGEVATATLSKADAR